MITNESRVVNVVNGTNSTNVRLPNQYVIFRGVELPINEGTRVRMFPSGKGIYIKKSYFPRIVVLTNYRRPNYQ